MTEPRNPAAAYSSGQGDPVPRHHRNPRRAHDREGRPMDLANAAENGVRFIRAICPPPCRHEGQVPLAAFPSKMAVRDVGLYLRCTACGRKGPKTELVWHRDRCRPDPLSVQGSADRAGKSLEGQRAELRHGSGRMLVRID